MIFLRWGTGGACLALGGCLPLHDPKPVPLEWAQGPWLAGGVSSGGGGAYSVIIWLVLLALLAWAARRAWRRRVEEGGGRGVAVDREDLALLRTAREALGYLLTKRLKQSKVTRLADWARGRKGGG